MANNARYWVGIGYLENMKAGWPDEIGDILEVPYCYCIHDKDMDTEGVTRKPHIHLIVGFNNTTTYNHALDTFNRLSGQNTAFNTCKKILNLRHMYEYLIHNTDDCKKKGKYLYPASDRISGNGFDIGLMEQVSLADKERMVEEIADLIEEYKITNFMALRKYVRSNMTEEYQSVFRSYASYLEKLTRGNYQMMFPRTDFTGGNNTNEN